MEQSSSMKKGIAVSLAILFAVSLTANARGYGHGGYGCYGGYGGGHSERHEQYPTTKKTTSF